MNEILVPQHDLMQGYFLYTFQNDGTVVSLLHVIN